MSHVHKKIIKKANAVMSENVYVQAIIPPSGLQCLSIPSLKAAYSVTFDLLILELMFLFLKNTVK